MTVSELIQSRTTTKVLADPDRPLPTPDGSERAVIEAMMTAAHAAPHHFPCHDSHRPVEGDSPVPWRFYALDGAACRALRDVVVDFEGKTETTLRLLGATDGLIVVTWLPEPRSEAEPAGDGTMFDGTRRNMEHVAAAAAAVQNMLIVATDAGRRSFWSSGGPILLSPAARRTLGIPEAEIILAAVYLAPNDTSGTDSRPGARRAHAGPVESCSRWVEPKSTD